MTSSKKDEAHVNHGYITPENLRLFRLLFVAREDAQAIWRGDKPVAIREPLTEEVLEAHLSGEFRVGSYLIVEGDRTQHLVFDVDIHSRKIVKRIVKRLRRRNVRAYVERSKSKGYHIWLFFESPLHASDARVFAQVVLEGLDQSKIEVFPKQDKVSEDGLGNCIWLPLFGHDLEEERTVFIERDLKSVPEQWRFLRHIKRIPERRILLAGKELQGSTVKRFPQLPTKDTTGLNLPVCAQTILLHGVDEGKRNVALFTLTKHLRNAGMNQDHVEELVSDANKRCEPPLEDSEVAAIVNSVFKKGYTSLGCDDPFIASLCGDRCSVKREKNKPVEDTSNKSSKATKIVTAFLEEGPTFFHTPDKEPYVTLIVEGHEETYRVRDVHIQRKLARIFFERYGTAASSQALSDAVGLLEAHALFGGGEEQVFIRLAQNENRIYLDLCNQSWESIEISADGWKVVSDPPVKFRRARGMRSLPIPERGGSIIELRTFLNVAGDDDFVLLVSWLIAALSPRGPYPVLVRQGEAGSAKSTGSRVLRELVDPNTTPLRSEPRETRDLMIAAINSWCIAFDNVSHLGWRLSDDLCRLATGGGFSTRQLYTDQGEILFEAMRPVMLNGIDGVVSRSDLLDRSLTTYSPVIPEDRRRSEKDFWQDFRTAQPRILGCLLDAVSCALRRLRYVRLDRLPRMADFATWAVAAETAFGWPQGTFMKAYDSNRVNANTLALEASLIVPALRQVCHDDDFSGTATELLRKLDKRAHAKETTQKAWPKNGWELSRQLRSIAPNLRSAGLHVRFDEKTHGSRSKRLIAIVRTHSVIREGFAPGRRGPDGICRFPFPRIAARRTRS